MQCQYIFGKGSMKGTQCTELSGSDSSYCSHHIKSKYGGGQRLTFEPLNSPEDHVIDSVTYLMLLPNSSDENYKFISLNKLPECLAYFYYEQSVDDLDPSASEEFTLTLLCANKKPITMDLKMSPFEISLHYMETVILGRSSNDCNPIVEYIRERATEMRASEDVI